MWDVLLVSRPKVAKYWRTLKALTPTRENHPPDVMQSWSTDWVLTERMPYPLRQLLDAELYKVTFLPSTTFCHEIIRFVRCTSCNSARSDCYVVCSRLARTGQTARSTAQFGSVCMEKDTSMSSHHYLSRWVLYIICLCSHWSTLNHPGITLFNCLH